MEYYIFVEWNCDYTNDVIIFDLNLMVGGGLKNITEDDGEGM